MMMPGLNTAYILAIIIRPSLRCTDRKTKNDSLKKGSIVGDKDRKNFYETAKSMNPPF
jgi:hypothetical protein